MARKNDSHPPRHLRLVPSRPSLPPAPVLRPDAPVSPADDALLTAIARQARDGDPAARDLLWRAFAPRLEPALLRCGRIVYQRGWARRDGRPWALDDLRQEAWLVFADLIAAWNGEGSFVPYVTAYFPWRLSKAMRRLAPPRATPMLAASTVTTPDDALGQVEREMLLAAIDAALAPEEATILHLRVSDELSWREIARRLELPRRSLSRRWRRVRRIAVRLLVGPAEAGSAHGDDGAE